MCIGTDELLAGQILKSGVSVPLKIWNGFIVGGINLNA
jgi:hypothetical protein